LFAPPGFIGRVVGTGEAFGAAGSAIGLLAGGALVDHVRLSVLLNAQASIYGTCALICLLVVARVPRPDAAITDAELTHSELAH
jgi:hypothetical protein